MQTNEKRLNMFQTDFSNTINFEYSIKCGAGTLTTESDLTLKRS